MLISIHQTNTRPEPEKNAETVHDEILAAASKGSVLACFPEAVNILREDPQAYLTDAPLQDACPVLKAAKIAAAASGISVHLGSLLIRTGAARIANRSYLINAFGEVQSTYDKIHLFDVDLPGTTPFRESDVVAPGADVVVAKAAEATLGLAICFDLRFPSLFQALTKAGADVLMVPAAFSPITGPVHWLPLLKARAIETGSYVVAAGQCGQHQGSLSSHGHSVVISPWGEVVAEAGRDPEILFAEISLKKVEEARGRIPTLNLKRVS